MLNINFDSVLVLLSEARLLLLPKSLFIAVMQVSMRRLSDEENSGGVKCNIFGKEVYYWRLQYEIH